MRVAVIGLGYWGPNLVRNFANVSGVEVAMGCDLSTENLRKVALDFPTVVMTKHYREVLKKQDISAIAIATPVATHYQIAKEALLSGKHVLLEKPMTKTSKQAEEIVRLARKKKRVLMVGHTFVYSSAVQLLKKIVKKGELGKPYYYDSVRVSLGVMQNDVNVIWDLALHDFSILSYIFEEKPLSIWASGSSYQGKQEELAHVIVRFVNVVAHIHVSWLSPVKLRTILIGGSRKTVLYDDTEESEKVKIYHQQTVSTPHLYKTEPLFREVSCFIDCVRNSKQPLTDGEEGFKIIRLLEGADRSLRAKAEVRLR